MTDVLQKVPFFSLQPILTHNTLNTHNIKENYVQNRVTIQGRMHFRQISSVVKISTNLISQAVCQPNSNIFRDPLPVWGNPNLIFNHCPWCIFLGLAPIIHTACRFLKMTLCVMIFSEFLSRIFILFFKLF